jgi:bifunctional ADP-heptose synthase (sugar kinase/adenylyltransferase)
MSQDTYNYKNIFSYVKDFYSIEELDTLLCFEVDELRSEFADSDNIISRVKKAILFFKKRERIEDLLKLLEKNRPDQYKLHEPEFRTISPAKEQRNSLEKMREELIELCKLLRNKNKSIVVIGEVMLDHKMMVRKGASFDQVQEHEVGLEKIYVLESKDKENKTLGGAANIAHAFSKVSKVTLIGVVGSDEEGIKLVKLCKTNGIDFIPIKISELITTTKIYCYSYGIQIGTMKMGFEKAYDATRIDREDKIAMNKFCREYEDAIIKKIKTINKPIDCVLLKDHEKGMFQSGIIKAISEYYKDKLIFLDPKYSESWKNFSGMKFEAALPNIKEAAYGVWHGDEQVDTLVKTKCADLFGDEDYRHLVIDYPHINYFIIKADCRGAVVVSRDHEGKAKYSAIKQLNVDLKDFRVGIGCGDLFDAFFVSGILNGASLKKSALLANFAAGHRTKKPLGEVMTPEEVISLLEREKLDDPNGYFKRNEEFIAEI